jgi:hypothetical protein
MMLSLVDRDGRSTSAAAEGEVALASGESHEAIVLADRSLAGLGPSEVLLQARVMAVAAEAARDSDQMQAARARYGAAFQRDPGVFRRLEFPVPVEIRSSGSDVAADVAAMLSRSPRFTVAEGGLSLSVQVDGAGARVCLTGEQGQQIGCAEFEAKALKPGEHYAQRIAEETQKQLFSPRIDLTQMDINSLDGQNLAGRDALETLFQ